MLLDAGYDAWVRADAAGARFRDEVLAAHRRTNRVVSPDGRLQPAWPLALGTQPWALARELSAVSPTSYVVRPVLPWQRDDSWVQVVDACAAGRPVGLYVGSPWLPRHVVLAVSGDVEAVTVYDPASGADTRVAREAWLTGTLGLSGWDRPWFLLLPELTRGGGGAATGPGADRPGR
jgi:hypothetical protein